MIQTPSWIHPNTNLNDTSTSKIPMAVPMIQFGVLERLFLGLGVGELLLSLSHWELGFGTSSQFFFFNLLFGGWYRICPGRHISDTTLYVAVSNVLAVYNIKPPTDDEGNEVKLTEEVTSGMLSSVDLFIRDRTWSCFWLTQFCMNRYMVPFKCVIEPRSSAALALIQGVW